MTDPTTQPADHPYFAGSIADAIRYLARQYPGEMTIDCARAMMALADRAEGVAAPEPAADLVEVALEAFGNVYEGELELGATHWTDNREHAMREVVRAIGPRIRAQALEDAAKLIEGGKEYDGADLTETLERLQYAHEWMRNQQRDALAAAIRKLGPATRAGATDGE